MLGYMSIREAAARWDISERRVQKLCEDGKLANTVRFGRKWGIPAGTGKPADGRNKKYVCAATHHYTERQIYIDLSALGGKILSQTETCTVYQIKNDTGSGIATMYHVFPGIKLIYNEMHMTEFKGHSAKSFTGAEDVMEIGYCREGRFEVESHNSRCAYIADGDLVVSVMSHTLKSSFFPLAHYRGITIFLDIPLASQIIETLSETLGIINIDLNTIKQKLCASQPFFIMRSTDSIQHVFSELYDAPDTVKESYIKLKMMEIMLFINRVEPELSVDRQRYFYRTQVNTVKAMRDFMTEHIDKQFTLDELSIRFNIPLTPMKNCFKSVFGAPIHNYMREYRLQTAATMLRETNEPVADIAAKVGYDSQTNFTVAFKSRTGLTPSEYRQVSV